MATIIRMPALVTGTTDAIITNWLVAVGQSIEVDTPLADIETEKATIEYLSEVSGTVLSLEVTAGATVGVGAPIAVVGSPGEPVPDQTAAASPDTAASAQNPAPAPPAPGAGSHGTPRLFASPLVRRLAKERGVDLAGLTGTGPNGRIVRRDLDATGVPAAIAPQRPAESAPYEVVPLTPMRRAIARRLTESATTVPHFSLQAHCRVDRLLSLRAEINAAGVRLSVNDLVVKAVACALRQVPEANCTWAADQIHRYQRVDVAIAVAIDGGLVTPVIRDADRLSLTELARCTADVAARARIGGLAQAELEGGSFTVSNLGGYGVSAFSAIINPPHAAILAVGAARQVPVVDDGELAVGTVMTVTLSADHRVLDGALAAQWLQAFVGHIEQPLTMLV